MLKECLRGKYVLAVSGGVDSVSLLDLLAKQSEPGLNLVIAHFDHGIRPDSNKDRLFVESLAKKYSFKFVYGQARLGNHASEQQAREARYQFLWLLVGSEKADGLITAHHEDDLIETAILNMVRGTNRKGLTALASNPKVIRPLLHVPKSEIINYAKKHHLAWQEDSTNQDVKYLRNYIRHNIIPKLDAKGRQSLLCIINQQIEINAQIDKQLTELLEEQMPDNLVPREWLSSLDYSLSLEVLATWLRQNGLREFDRGTLNRLSIGLKTAKVGKKLDVIKGWQISANRDNLALEYHER